MTMSRRARGAAGHSQPTRLAAPASRGPGLLARDRFERQNLTRRSDTRRSQDHRLDHRASPAGLAATSQGPGCAYNNGSVATNIRMTVRPSTQVPPLLSTRCRVVNRTISPIASTEGSQSPPRVDEDRPAELARSRAVRRRTQVDLIGGFPRARALLQTAARSSPRSKFLACSRQGSTRRPWSAWRRRIDRIGWRPRAKRRPRDRQPAIRVPASALLAGGGVDKFERTEAC